MAIGTPTLLTAGNDTSNSVASYSTASITPTANEVVVLYVHLNIGSGTAGTITPTHPSITFSSAVKSRLFNGTLRRIEMFTGVASSSPSASAITLTPSSATQTGCSWVVQQWTGVDTTTPVVQSNSGSGTSTTMSTTLSAFASGNNATAAGYAQDGSVTFTAGTNFTQLGNTSVATPTVRLAGAYYLGQDTTPDATSTASSTYGFIAAELNAAATTLTLNASGSELAVASGTATYSGAFNAFRGLVLKWP